MVLRLFLYGLYKYKEESFKLKQILGLDLSETGALSRISEDIKDSENEFEDALDGLPLGLKAFIMISFSLEWVFLI
jgi:hypothetical protein